MFSHYTSGSSSFGRAIAFQAIGGRFEPGLPLTGSCRCSSVVEHFLGREEVVSPILTNGSIEVLVDREEVVIPGIRDDAH